MIKSFNCRFYYWLLVLLIFYVKGLEGFFIKDSSGLCFTTGPSIHSDNRGNFHYVLLDQDCLHDAAQFRFMNNGVLYNIGRDGCFVLFYSFSERADVFAVLHARPDNVDTCKAEDAVSQNSRGLLLYKPRREECVALRAPARGSFRTDKSAPGDYLLPSSTCDKKAQQFTFGSVTCEGTVTTDVNCNPDQVMVIQNAVYGRYNNMTTCLHNGNANCTVSVTRMVKSLCEGRQNCTIMVNNELSKEDPCPGLQNYLYLEYNCADCVVPVKQFFVNDVGLSTSALPNEGFLEINISDTRSKVCSKSLNSGANEVVCRQLGYRGTENNPSVSNVYRNSRNFSGKINCVGNETVLSHCCVNAAREETCSELAYVNCIICSEPLLENKKKFPDTAFTASQSLDNHDAPNARLSSNSSWCAPPNGSHYLKVDLGRVYVINSVTTFGDSSSANWVTSYKLTYTSDGIKWTEQPAAAMKGNTYAYSNAATSNLNNIRARILKFIPLSSNGQRCMRIEICGHKLFPDQPRNLTITHKTSSSVTFSWLPPDNEPTDKPVLLFRIKIEQGSDIVYNVSATNETDEKELRDLSRFTEYKLSVAARNVYGFGKESTVSFITAEEAPSGPPRNVTVMARNSSSLFVSWKEPDEDKKNGIITNYTVCISHFKAGPCFKSYTTSWKNMTVANLNSSTKYSVRVLSRTRVGSGNFSLDLERFTNGNPPNKPLNKTTQTLLFTLPSPKGSFSYFQVIAMKLLDDNTPSQSPDSFQESDLVNYADAKTSPEPKPYIAAVFAMTNDLDFQLGNGKNFIIPSARRRRSTTNSYYNGPLEPDTSYSVFQRVYINQDDYYSTDWSPPARTSPSPTTIPSSSTPQSTSVACKCAQDCSKTSFYVAIATLLVMNVASIAMVIYLSRFHPKFQNCSKDTVNTDVQNEAFREDVYDEVQTSPSSSGVNLGDHNPGTYEELHHRGKDEDNHVYQSLKNTT